MGSTAAWWLLLMTLLVATGLFFAVIRPYFLSLEAQQNRASQQYVETVESNLYKMAADYEQLDTEAQATSDTTVAAGKRAQQRAIVDRMRLECSKLRPEARPASLGRYGC